MKFFFNTKSGWWPIVTVGFLMVALWGTLFFNTIPGTDTATAEGQKQTAYEEILPNFLAPVIRKDVQKQSSSEEDESAMVKIPIPKIGVLFTNWK